MTEVFWCDKKKFEVIKKLLASIPGAELEAPIKVGCLYRCLFHINISNYKPIQKLTEKWRNEDGWPKTNNPYKKLTT